MKNVLITGSGSYVGTQVAAYLMKWPDRFRVETLDVRGDGWKTASFSGFDAVFHVAALVHDAKRMKDESQWPAYEAVNTTLTLEIAEKAKREGVRQFLFMSSAAVYGVDSTVGKKVIIDGTTSLRPRDNYGKSKLAAEQGLLPMSGDGFRVAILRPPMIYGKGCKGNYVTLAKLARKMPVFPRVENQRSMLYIDNFAEFLRQVIENEDAGIFCPQNREYTNTAQMVQAMGKARGKRIFLIPGFAWAIRLVGHCTDLAGKAFGNWCYDRQLSDYREDYCIKTLEESIFETEDP